MKYLLSVAVFLSYTLLAAAQEIPRGTVKRLQKGKIKDDTSFVYHLPYKDGHSHLVAQGYYGGFSHKTMVALDFKMKKRTPICAARGGVVTHVWVGDSLGGLKKIHWQYGNMITIRHEDGSRANYFHLSKDGALVKVGDTVAMGQPIALSGHTGYSAFPHLHFWVSAPDAYGRLRDVPVRFLTRKGPRYLRPMRIYKAVK
jgi:murein DD-endopeptidase MepM/ murein hydrolase activator NlpD